MYREKISSVHETALSRLDSDLASLRGKTCNPELMQDICGIIELLDADVQCTACGVRAKIRQVVGTTDYAYVHHATGIRDHRVGVTPPILNKQ